MVNGLRIRTFHIEFFLRKSWFCKDQTTILCFLATEKDKLPSLVESEDVANVIQIFWRNWITLFKMFSRQHSATANLWIKNLSLMGKWKNQRKWKDLRFKKCAFSFLKANSTTQFQIKWTNRSPFTSCHQTNKQQEFQEIPEPHVSVKLQFLEIVYYICYFVLQP